MLVHGRVSPYFCFRPEHGGEEMIAIGCLLLVILPIAGLALGGVIGGPQAARWAALAGLLIAATVCALSAYALAKAGRQR